MEYANSRDALNLKQIKELIEKNTERAFNYWVEQVDELYCIEDFKSLKKTIESDNFKFLSEKLIIFTFSIGINSDWSIFTGVSFSYSFPYKMEPDAFLDYIKYNNRAYREKKGEKRVFVVQSTDYAIVKEKALFILNEIINSYEYFKNKPIEEMPVGGHEFLHLI